MVGVRGTEMTPRAYAVLSLMQWHRERGETASVDVLADETRMTFPELSQCLREVSKHVTETLWPDGQRSVLEKG